MMRPEIEQQLRDTLPAILSIKDIASILRCSETTIRRLIRDKGLQAFLADGEWNILREDFIQYLDNCSN